MGGLAKGCLNIAGSNLMLRFVLTTVCLAFCGALLSQEEKTAPKEAKSIAEILKAVEKMKGFGIVSSNEFQRQKEKTFFVWYCPYSGRAACHVHAYAFDTKKEKWIRFLDRVFEGTVDVSVEVGHRVRIRDMQGKVVFEDKSRE